MAGTTVVVAIPRDDDPVWKYSSEEIPHLTLLSLGDQSNNPKLPDMGSYLEHAANTMLHTFGFTVQRRGILGAKGADVLFFEKDNRVMKMLEEFRRGVLADSAFFETYVTSDQFPEWVPHLTMGFPETPANKVDDDDNRPTTLHWVEFDRIAIWPGDYAGPEYRLKKEHHDLMMSDKTREFLAHHGVKGMKWGVRQDKGHEGEQAKTKTIAKLDKQYNKSLTGMSGFVKTNNAVANRINPKLDVLNAKPDYQVDMTKPENAAVHKKYIEEYRGHLQKSLEEAMDDIGSNASGTQRIHLIMVGEGINTSYEGYTEVIRHATDGRTNFIVKPKFNSRGQITGQDIAEVKERTLKQSEDNFGEATLQHYGVKGMKWGRRKDDGIATPVSLAATPGKRVKAVGGTNQPASDDAKQAAASRQIARASSLDALSNKELQSLVTRLNLEQQYNRLTAQPPSAMQKGKKFILKQLKDPNSRRNMQKSIAENPGVKYYKDVKAVGAAIEKVKL